MPALDSRLDINVIRAALVIGVAEADRLKSDSTRIVTNSSDNVGAGRTIASWVRVVNAISMSAFHLLTLITRTKDQSTQGDYRPLLKLPPAAAPASYKTCRRTPAAINIGLIFGGGTSPGTRYPPVSQHRRPSDLCRSGRTGDDRSHQIQWELLHLMTPLVACRFGETLSPVPVEELVEGPQLWRSNLITANSKIIEDYKSTKNV
ncbi:hypothetical protein EVAR_7112_1 [Eumeta japonica]|uniref:Uncharacterized protein n=1 Tax=Eumeta variegata TaxID=151549 RepID=A0A4C1U6G6_EUMVA|nr:hypothetical protein EVAR_7112_1 [Eumeta japonica]